LYNLGFAAMRGDTIAFWVGEIENGVPFAMAVTKWFVFTFDLIDSTFAKRFPSAVWGILTVPAAYGLGRTINGKKFGLLLAALVALNPFCIQCSREAYFYAPLTLGAFMAIWASADLFKYSQSSQPLFKRVYYTNAIGFFLLTAVHPPGWPMAVMLGIVNVSFIRAKRKQRGRLGTEDLVILGTYVIIASITALSSWGPLALIQTVLDGSSSTTVSTFSEGGNSFKLLYYSLTNLSWGWTPFRLGFTITVVVIGLIVCVKRAQTAPLYWLIIDLVLFGGTIQIFARKIIFPAFLVVLGIGLSGVPDLLKNSKKLAMLFPFVFTATGLGLWIAPDYQITQLNGYVKPYHDIQKWVDSNLQQNTLVLVDRWWEIDNELFVYGSTNITFTFTVPNEPVEAYLNNRWRESVINFVSRFPQSGFLEIRKSFWERPEIGPWHWPEQYFRQHVAFTNEAGLKLREWGLGSRGDFYSAYKHGLIVDLYYDTREDVLEKAREAGRSCIALYGRGWHYAKPWRITQDYFDWRVIEGWAEMDLYNLTSSNLQVAVSMNAVAPIQDKKIKLSNGSLFDFKLDQQIDVLTRAMKLPPGRTPIMLTDPYWNVYNVPLLVAEVNCRLVSSSGETGAHGLTAAPAPVKPSGHKVNYTITPDGL